MSIIDIYHGSRDESQIESSPDKRPTLNRSIDSILNMVNNSLM